MPTVNVPSKTEHATDLVFAALAADAQGAVRGHGGTEGKWHRERLFFTGCCPLKTATRYPLIRHVKTAHRVIGRLGVDHLDVSIQRDGAFALMRRQNLRQMEARVVAERHF